MCQNVGLGVGKGVTNKGSKEGDGDIGTRAGVGGEGGIRLFKVFDQHIVIHCDTMLRSSDTDIDNQPNFLSI